MAEKAEQAAMTKVTSVDETNGRLGRKERVYREAPTSRSMTPIRSAPVSGGRRQRRSATLPIALAAQGTTIAAKAARDGAIEPCR